MSYAERISQLQKDSQRDTQQILQDEQRVKDIDNSIQRIKTPQFSDQLSSDAENYMLKAQMLQAYNKLYLMQIQLLQKKITELQNGFQRVTPSDLTKLAHTHASAINKFIQQQKTSRDFKQTQLQLAIKGQLDSMLQQFHLLFTPKPNPIPVLEPSHQAPPKNYYQSPPYTPYSHLSQPNFVNRNNSPGNSNNDIHNKSQLGKMLSQRSQVPLQTKEKSRMNLSGQEKSVVGREQSYQRWKDDRSSYQNKKQKSSEVQYKLHRKQSPYARSKSPLQSRPELRRYQMESNFLGSKIVSGRYRLY